jgi:2-oxo-3-hexenedioate decarboxylase
MSLAPDPSDTHAIAAEVLATLGGGRQIAPFSARPGGLTLDTAYRVLPLLRTAFEARGETILGRKIGFTNRSIWTQYGVYAPIWGYVTDATTRDLAPDTALRTADFAEPRLEPEIMFGLARTPAPDMDEAALLDCIDWVALGYEIVQSLFPDWRFAPADTVAANALHGALLVGERHTVAPRKSEWLRELVTFELDLSCDGRSMDHGGGASVLDGPLSALRHLVMMLAQDPHNPPLGAGEIVSTGTLTKALPVAPGERWTARPSGIPLAPATLRFA